MNRLCVAVMFLLPTVIYGQVGLYNYKGTPIVGFTIEDASQINYLAHKGLMLDSAAVLYEKLYDTYIMQGELYRSLISVDKERITMLEKEVSKWKDNDDSTERELIKVRAILDKQTERTKKYKSQRNTAYFIGAAVVLTVYLLVGR